MSTTFAEFGLLPPLLEAITLMGYEEPTPVQAQAIPFLLSSQQDLIALAQTGTGKTAAFALPCLHKLDIETVETQVLILSPTRELSLQTAKEMKKFAKKMSGFRSVALYGGGHMGTQARALAKGCHVVIGTPGRTLDFIRQGRLDVSTVKMVILDEADEMLKMGFKDDLDAILDGTPEDKQTLLFSATMPKGIEKIINKNMSGAHQIAVSGRNQANRSVLHQYSLIHPRDRFDALRRWVDALPGMEGIIFCRTRSETMDIFENLRKEGYAVDLINGDLTQENRDRVMRRFHLKEVKILVATDVAARGLDVDNLTHVINYTLPDDLEVYVHRSGRTGRAGNQGVCVSLISPTEEYRMRQIERMANTTLNQVPIPTAQDVISAQLANAIQSLNDATLPEGQFEPQIDEMLSMMQGLEQRDLATKVLAVLSGELLRQYQNTEDLNQRAQARAESRERRRNKRERGGRERGGRERGGRERDGRGRNEQGADRGGRTPRPRNGNFVMCQINIGRRQKLSPHRLMGLVNERIVGSKPDFGDIDIQATSTQFEVEARMVPDVIAALTGATFEGREVKARTKG